MLAGGGGGGGVNKRLGIHTDDVYVPFKTSAARERRRARERERERKKERELENFILQGL